MCQHRSYSSSMEVTGATDVGMHYRRTVRGGCGTFGIEVALEDRVDRGVGTRADLKRPAAGGLQPLPAITLGQADDADRGAEALLGVRALAQGFRASVGIIRLAKS